MAPLELKQSKSNQELFEVVEAARVQNTFADSLKELTFDELGRIDKYLDQVMGANAEGTRDHNLWKQVRDELATRVTDKVGEIEHIATTVGPKSEKLVRAMTENVRNRVSEVMEGLADAA